MAGASVPLGYFCAAGALITSNGWLDVLLWGLTRRVLLFNSDVDAEEAGLETFAFMRTPPERKYGNMVWVQGASGRDEERQAQGSGQGQGQHSETRGDDAKDGFGWWGAVWRRRNGRLAKGQSRESGRRGSAGQILGHRRTGSRGISQESLKRGDMAIQMDIVTTVVVDVESDKLDSRGREYSLSMNGSEKDERQHRG